MYYITQNNGDHTFNDNNSSHLSKFIAIKIKDSARSYITKSRQQVTITYANAFQPITINQHHNYNLQHQQQLMSPTQQPQQLRFTNKNDQ